jgi:hypothetical protein
MTTLLMLAVTWPVVAMIVALRRRAEARDLAADWPGRRADSHANARTPDRCRA